MNAVMRAVTSWQRNYVQAVAPKKPIVTPAPKCRTPCGDREYQPDDVAISEGISWPGCMWCENYRKCTEVGYGPEPEQ